MLSIRILLFICLLSFTHCVDVVTRYGPVRGNTITLHTGDKINSFIGIPFARPPVGGLRFKAPEDPLPWTQTLEVTKNGAMCPQTPIVLTLTHPLWGKYSEDCLHLSVYAPNVTSGRPYPVMIWFHGGAYQSGGYIQYPGHFLAQKEVVVVIANYRLGNLGFLSTGDSAAAGNWGLLDQIKAMQFVQRNIAAFGGDPNRVTIFGQSAGSSSAGLHLVSPLSEGLFHQVIYESGTELSFWAVTEPEQKPEDYSRQLATRLNCTTVTSEAMVDCLRAVDWKTLNDVQITCKTGFFCQGFEPVVDGKGGFLPDLPQKLRSSGKVNKLPTLGGFTREDGSLYTAILIPESFENCFNRSTFLDIIKDRLVPLFSAYIPESKIPDFIEMLNIVYSPWPHVDNCEENRKRITMMITDAAWGAPTDYSLNDQASRNVPTYGYVFGFRSNKASELLPEWFGVPHNGEIPYVIGWPFLQLNEAVRDESEIFIDIVDWDDDDRKYANFVMTLWTNFAKYGNPTPEPLTNPLDNRRFVWPKFTNVNQTMILLDRTVERREDYRALYNALWREYVYYVSGVEYPGPGIDGFRGESSKRSIRKKHLNQENRVNQVLRKYLNGKLGNKN